MRIIFPNPDGTVAIGYPMSTSRSVQDIALQGVPFGTPFLIVEDSEIPEDLSTSDAWEVDFSNPDGFGMGPQRWLISKAQEEISRGILVEENMDLIDRMKAEIFDVEGVRL